MKKLSKAKKISLWVSLSVLIIIFITFLSCLIYFEIYYHATDEGLKYLESTDNVEVIEYKKYYTFTPKEKSYDDGIVFYTGAKVEAEAYAVLCYEIASEGVAVVMPKIAFRFAFFGKNMATKGMTLIPEVKNWYVGGHSLGGVIASQYASEHEEIKGVILLASYSIKDISNKNVLSIYGSNDLVVNLKNYEKNKTNLPNDFTEYIINGGNHGGFALYGHQKGDGNSTITSLEQCKITADYIKRFVG